MNLYKYTLTILLLSFGFSACSQDSIPFKIASLFDLKSPETLGLPFAKKCETITIFSPGVNDNKYNHGVVLYPFKGELYAMWQSSQKDEDGKDTQVYYSKSSNGVDWNTPMALTDKWEHGIKTSGGWWSYSDTLVAFINVWPQQSEGPKQGFAECFLSTDGKHWQYHGKLLDNKGKAILGIIEQDLHALPDGRIITAFHMQPGLIAKPFYTDDPSGIKGWTQGEMENLSIEKHVSRELEPSWFYQNDGNIVIIFRDQRSSFKRLASVSKDRGEHWSTPVIIDSPDSRAKQSAGNLPDGTAYLVNNPSGNKNRFPLVITLSRDGYTFDKAFLLRGGGKDLPPMKYEGKYKRKGFSYPKSVVWQDYLYVSYATNKEVVELTRIPIEYLIKEAHRK